MTINSALLTSLAVAAFASSVLAADLPARKGAPVAPPASANCLETNGLPTDVFGFTTGSDVTDVGAWGGTLTANGNFTARSTRLTGVTGVAQVATGLFRCFEVGPYVFVGGSNAKDRSGFSGNSSIYGGGVEFKYKFLGRDVHGVGATFDLDVSAAGNRLSGVFGAGSFTSYAVAARLFLDREIVTDRLFGALNIEHVSNFAQVGGSSIDSSALSIRAALSTKVTSNFYAGVEALYSRTYFGASYKTYLGDAFAIGPNFLWAINDKWTLNGAYQVQVAGKSRLAPGNLNLANYNQHYARLKLGYSF
ncbi:MAG: hypothetical protein ACRCUE_17815 [Bosea sp. (in: a-proteobacteria)]